MKRTLAALVLAVIIAPISALAQDKALEGDLKKLQGKWSAKGPDGTPFTMSFENGKVEIKLTAPSGMDATIAGSFTVDEKATPRAMNWTSVKSKTGNLPDLVAIYEFTNDDTLKMAGIGGKERPKEFIEKGKEPSGGRPNTMIFTRVK